MDPLSTSASISALLHVTHVILKYARDVKDFGKTRKELLERAIDVRLILKSLKDREEMMKRTDPTAPWFKGLISVHNSTSSDPEGGPAESEKGPLSKIYDAMVDIISTLGIPCTRVKVIYHRLRWPDKKSKLEETFKNIDRWKSDVYNILAGDDFAQSMDSNKRLQGIEEAGARREREQHLARERKARIKEKEAIIAWLSPLDFFRRHREVSRNRCPDVGQTLLQSEEFQAWAKGSSWTLTCLAIPGAGKTVLCSIVVDHLRSHWRLPVLCLYLNDKDQEVQTREALLGSLLKQLLQEQNLDAGFRSEGVRKIYEDSRREAPPTLEGLTEAVHEEISTYSRVMLVVDALDEALPDLKADLLGDIETIGSGVLHIMTTSRPFEGEYGSGLRVSCNFCHRQSLKIYYACYFCAEEVDVCQKCMDLGRRCPGHPSHTLVQPYPEVFKDVNPAEDDIRLYVDWALNHEISQGMRNVKQHDPRLSYVNERTTYLGDICRENADSNLEERIRQSVVAKAQGMFVSAKLYMDSLKFKTSAEEIEEALESPANIIADLYNNAVLRINNFSLENPNTNATDIGRKTLSLVAYAYRTLTLPELQDALAVDLKRPEFRMKRPYSRKVIFDSTAGLLDVHSDVGEVRLHLTAVEHFRKNRSRMFPNSATEIVQVLLQYLDRDELGRPCEGQQEFEEFRAREKKYHLMSYAYQHWGKHASEAETEPQVLASVLQYFGQPSRVDAAIQAACYLNPDDPARWDVRIGANALHLCAWFGLAGFMPELIEEQRLDVNSQDPTYGQTPLMYACRQGHTAAVAKLLDLGADVNLCSRRGKTAMFEAVVEDRADVATLLLKEDKLDITATHAFESGRTALMLASQRGLLDALRAKSSD